MAAKQKNRAGGGLVVLAAIVVAFIWFNGRTHSDVPAKPAVSDADCRQDLQCWMDRQHVDGFVACQSAVEDAMTTAYEWDAGWLEPKFSHGRWTDADHQKITFIGDRLKVQNAFGGWLYVVYQCDFDPASKSATAVRWTPGRL